MDLIAIVAFIYTAASTLVVGFQFCLAFGVAWGSYAMAGKFPGKFPPTMRVAAVAQAILLISMALVVLSVAEVKGTKYFKIPDGLIWGVVVFSLLAVIANSATPNAKERQIWLPVTLIMFATSLTVAMASR